jgi:GTP 3',8-cyclase
MEPLLDGWGREIKSLRISVTDKCNFRCRIACRPRVSSGFRVRRSSTTRRSRASCGSWARWGSRRCGTGGEPLVRRDLPALVSLLADVPGVNDLSLTTNGVLSTASRLPSSRPV